MSTEVASILNLNQQNTWENDLVYVSLGATRHSSPWATSLL